MRINLYIFAIFSLCIAFTNAQAATIQRYSDPVMGCTALLSGVIEEGDAEHLGNIISQTNFGGYNRLCLDSSGGSLEEGLRIARLIQNSHYWGTAIASGHVCESACSIIFLAGGDTEGGYSRVRPVMHPHATLGLHAPSLNIPDGEYSEEIVSRAYEVALEAMRDITLFRSNNPNFPEELLYFMLSTPPDEMFYINTVGRAAAFNIAVFPVALNTENLQIALELLCRYRERNSDRSSDIYDIEAGVGNAVNARGVVQPAYVRVEESEISAFFSSGFFEEAYGSCDITIKKRELARVDTFMHSDAGAFPIEVNEAIAYSYMSYPSNVLLRELNTDIGDSIEAFQRQAERYQAPIAIPSCEVGALQEQVRVINVNEYVNLRSGPSLQDAIVARANLGERLTISRDGYWYYSTSTGRECASLCQRLAGGDNNQSLLAAMRECIEGAQIWQEVRNARGDQGYVSVYFLSAGER